MALITQQNEQVMHVWKRILNYMINKLLTLWKYQNIKRMDCAHERPDKKEKNKNKKKKKKAIFWP